jgi:hypothetical protein
MLADMDRQARSEAKSNWRELYSAALVELNPVQLRKKIDLANTAIHQRLYELAPDLEQRAIVEALRTLQTMQGATAIHAPGMAELPEQVLPGVTT